MKILVKTLLFICVAINSGAITPVFTCGFECGVLGANGEHWSSAATASISTTTIRSGSRSFRFNATASTAGAACPVLFTSGNIYVIRVYIRFASLPIADYGLFETNNTGQPGAYFKQSDSKIYAGISSATGATGVSVTTGVWYRLDIKVNSSANPWLIDVNVDGTSCGQYSNAVAAENTTQIRIGGGGTQTVDVFYDDLVVSQTSGDYPIGKGYVNHFIPVTPDGTHSGLTANDYERTLTGTDILNSTTDSYQLLDDVPLESGSSVDWVNMVAPAASSYVEHIFGPASGISTPTIAPRAVEIIFGHHAAGTGNYNAVWLLNDNGTTDAIYTASAVAGSTTMLYKRKHYATAPTGGAWTLSGAGNFNNIRTRFGATGTVDANPDVYFDCAMIEAEFDEPTARPRRVIIITK